MDHLQEPLLEETSTDGLQVDSQARHVMEMEVDDGGLSKEDAGGAAQAEAGHAAMGWQSVCAIMVSVILGLGVLGLSEAFAALGWILSFSFIGLIALGALYSGTTICSVVDDITERTGVQPRSYPTLGRMTFGMAGQRVVEVVQLVFLGGAICAVHLTAATSLSQVVSAAAKKEFCLVASFAIIAAVVLPVMQARSLKDVTWVAVIGVITIITPLVMFVTELEVSGPDKRPVVGLPKETNLEAFASKFTTIIFAYQGQTIFPELIGDMRNPKQFPKAVRSSLAFMTLVYSLFGAIGYYYLGSGAIYLQDWVDANRAKLTTTSVANVCLIFHVLSGFIINGNVFNHALNDRIVPRKHRKSRLAWFLVSLVTVSGSFALANVLPNLSALISVVGATCGLALTFIFPASFILRLKRKDGVPHRKLIIHWLILCVAIVGLGICSFATVSNLIHEVQKSKHRPFSCSTL